MAHSKGVVAETSSSSLDVEFIQDLIPTAQRVALLYNLSYLCLGNFPKLEKWVRKRALETQVLFGDSEAILLKCILTSKNLVETLFPMLRVAIGKNKPNIAVMYLEKAKTWIEEIISTVQHLVEKYESHNLILGSTTSDVFAEKDETENKILNQNKDHKALQYTLEENKARLQEVTEDLKQKEQKINEKTQKLEEYVDELAKSDRKIGFLRSIMPFFRALLRSIVGMENASSVKVRILATELNALDQDKTTLRQKQWNLQDEVINSQMLVAKAEIERGSIPSPKHLAEIQTCLSRIQQIMFDLLQFWKKIDELLQSLKQKTFVGDVMIEDIDLKDMFLETITKAEEVWKTFGFNCATAKGIISVQGKDAYKFLEVCPSSLSNEDRQIQYDAVWNEMKKIRLDTPDIATLAITQ